MHNTRSKGFVQFRGPTKPASSMAVNSVLPPSVNQSTTTRMPSLETKFFKTTQIHPMYYYYNQKQTKKIQERQADLSPQITSIVQHVHSGLQTQSKKVQARRPPTTAPRKKTVVKTVKPKQVAATPSPPSKPEMREAEAQTRLSTVEGSTFKMPTRLSAFMSIPRLKAARSFRSQTKNYHVVPASGKSCDHFQHQQRYKKAMEQRALLEGMLVEHKQLQRDRQSMVNEIHMMRNYLDDIRSRLDNSLRKLNDSHNYTLDESELSSLRKKNGMRSLSLPRRAVV